MLVVEPGTAAQPRRDVAQQVAPGRQPLEALDLRLGLLDVAEVGQEQTLVRRHDARGVRAREAGQVADVDEVRDVQRVELALREQLHQPVAPGGARALGPHGRHFLSSSRSIASASR
jgi:hypothetical protein